VGRRGDGLFHHFTPLAANGLYESQQGLGHGVNDSPH